MQRLRDVKASKRIKPYWHSANYYRVVKKIKNVKQVDKSTVSQQNNNNNKHQSPPKEGMFFTEEVKDINAHPNCNNEVSTIFNDDDFNCDPVIEEEFDGTDVYDICDKLSLLEDLKDWSLSHKITLQATGDLLKILRTHGLDTLPKDARTLLSTPVTVEIVPMGAGKFWYNGIETNLIQQLSNLGPSFIPSSISLIFNIDGMSPFNSSLHQFWPISFLIDELRTISPMIIAIYYGEGKPPLQPYFTRFVKELNELLTKGIHLQDKHIKINVKCFVCDTQARSFIKGTPASNAENGSCIKCTVVGEWDKKGRHMSYPRIHSSRRTDKSFRERYDEDHHKEDTPLIALPIDMVEDFIVADSLHLFDLGIMRRCLYGWREGSYNFKTKLSKTQTDQMSEMLERINGSKPLDIQRAIRSLKSLKFWKGSEYRVFLLYLGMVVLKDFLSQEVYEHFLMLSCAVTILSCNEYLKYLEIANKLLYDYIENFIELYGIDSISSNVHNLCHVVDDVKKFGPLPQISSYPFENALGHLKVLVRHGNLPLSQISKRVIELSKLQSPRQHDNHSVYAKSEIVGEKHELDFCIGVYKELFLQDNFILRADGKNSYFMTKDKSIIIMKNVTYLNNKLHIYGARVKDVHNYFDKPFASSHLNIFVSSVDDTIHYYNCKTENPKLYSINDVKCKIFRLRYHNEFVFIPLIHTLNT